MDKTYSSPEESIVDKDKLTPEEIARAEALGIPLECIAVLPSPFGVQAVAAIQLAKNKGLITSLDQCKALAGNAEELAKIIGNAEAAVITGIFARCACEKVFGGGGGGGGGSGECHGPNRV